MKIQCYDKLGWPVELFYNRPVTNFIRRCLHARGVQISIGTATRPSAPRLSTGTGGSAGQARAEQAPRVAPKLPEDARMPWRTP